MGWSFPRTSPARRGCANGFSDLLGIHASAANLFSVGGAVVITNRAGVTFAGESTDLMPHSFESRHYFDWHTQIDNPVETLDNAARHIVWGMDAFPYGVRRSTVALLCMLSVKAEQ